MKECRSWKKEMMAGIVSKAGNSIEYETGSWRTYKPIWNADKCNQCYRCYLFCPDMSVLLKDGKVSGIDYGHCKGCGICANECPKKAIEMVMG
jgi:pyruvate ferredoxin oxidoreductase delta subunit